MINSEKKIYYKKKVLHKLICKVIQRILCLSSDTYIKSFFAQISSLIWKTNYMNE